MLSNVLLAMEQVERMTFGWGVGEIFLRERGDVNEWSRKDDPQWEVERYF
jgi:hypothetical protein